jgi:hypothetical protein
MKLLARRRIVHNGSNAKRKRAKGDEEEDSEAESESEVKSESRKGKSRQRKGGKDDKETDDETDTVSLSDGTSTAMVETQDSVVQGSTSSNHRQWRLYSSDDPALPDIVSQSQSGITRHNLCYQGCAGTCICSGDGGFDVVAGASADSVVITSISTNPNLSLPRWIAAGQGIGAVVITFDCSH